MSSSPPPLSEDLSFPPSPPPLPPSSSMLASVLGTVLEGTGWLETHYPLDSTPLEAGLLLGLGLFVGLLVSRSWFKLLFLFGVPGKSSSFGRRQAGGERWTDPLGRLPSLPKRFLLMLPSFPSCCLNDLSSLLHLSLALPRLSYLLFDSHRRSRPVQTRQGQGHLRLPRIPTLQLLLLLSTTFSLRLLFETSLPRPRQTRNSHRSANVRGISLFSRRFYHLRFHRSLHQGKSNLSFKRRSTHPTTRAVLRKTIRRYSLPTQDCRLQR